VDDQELARSVTGRITRRSLSPGNPKQNHDRLLLELAYFLDDVDQNMYSHYMQRLWELMREMQEQARLTDRA